MLLLLLAYPYQVGLRGVRLVRDAVLTPCCTALLLLYELIFIFSTDWSRANSKSSKLAFAATARSQNPNHKNNEMHVIRTYRIQSLIWAN